MQGQVALVAGGTGNVGEGLVRGFLKAGARVAVPSRDEGRLQKLLQILGPGLASQVIPIAGDIADPDDGGRIREQLLAQTGRLDAVAASLGGWWQGAALVQTPLLVWNRLLNDLLTSHFVVAKHLLPVLLRNGGGAYTLINGFSGLEPYRGAGAVSVAAAAQLMLARALAAEFEGSAVKVNEVILGPIISRSRPAGRPEWLANTEVGDFVAKLSCGRTAHGKVFHLLSRPDLQEAEKELA